MSGENIQVVREFFAHLVEGDPAPELCDPAIEIRNWAESPVPGPYHGHDGLREWFDDVNDVDMGIDIQWFELEDVVELDGKRFVTIQRATGQGRSSGFELDQRWGSILVVHEGKIVSATGYPTPEQALEAAGVTQ